MNRGAETNRRDAAEGRAWARAWRQRELDRVHADYERIYYGGAFGGAMVSAPFPDSFEARINRAMLVNQEPQL